MAVTFDVAATSLFQFTTTSIPATNITVGSGANRIAVLMMFMSINNAGSLAVSLGGNSATRIVAADTGTSLAQRTMIWLLTNPPSGAQTFTASWTTACNADLACITMAGASQTLGDHVGSFTFQTGSNPATLSLTITSASGDLTSTIGFTLNAYSGSGTNQTLKWGIDSTEAGGDIGPGTGNTTHSWTDQLANQDMLISGVNVKAVADGAPAPPIQSSPLVTNLRW